MKIRVKFFAVDLPHDLKECTFDLPEDAVVEDALNACLKHPQINIEETYFKASMVLNGQQRTDLSDRLKDGDVLSILRTMEGG